MNAKFNNFEFFCKLGVNILVFHKFSWIFQYFQFLYRLCIFLLYIFISSFFYIQIFLSFVNLDFFRFYFFIRAKIEEKEKKQTIKKWRGLTWLLFQLCLPKTPISAWCHLEAFTRVRLFVLRKRNWLTHFMLVWFPWSTFSHISFRASLISFWPRRIALKANSAERVSITESSSQALFTGSRSHYILHQAYLCYNLQESSRFPNVWSEAL